LNPVEFANIAGEERKVANEVELQNHHVCEPLKMPFGSPDYSHCASALKAARKLQNEHDRREEAGFP
jgi:hypothetical protein